MRRSPAIAAVGVATCATAFAALAACLPGCGNRGAASAESCAPACSGDLVCRYQSCVAPPTACQANADCTGDQHCDTAMKECLPWGIGPGGTSDPSCQGTALPGVFFPGVQCHWQGPPSDDPYPGHVNVLATPMVAAFDPGAPSIAFTAYNGTDYALASCGGSDPTAFGVIRVIDGATCAQQATFSAPGIIGAAPLAIADLGGDDATPEIVAATATGLVAFTRRADGWGVLWQASAPTPVPCDWAGPSIHDLDDDGRPEVIFDGAVYDGQSGAVIDGSLAGKVDGVGVGYIPIVADVDGDGVPELITGDELYSWDKANRRWAPKRGLPAANGLVAVGDFGTFPASQQDDRAHTDGIAETVVVFEGTVHVFTITGREVFTAALQGDADRVGVGGPPILADFDGDGRLEIGVAGATAYNVLDPDCRATTGPPDAATCASLSTTGVLWATPTLGTGVQSTGSAAFDFDGDGRPEIVHGDPCFTRIYDGRTGAVLYARARTSCTWFENPSVADTNGDFRAELVTTSNTNSCNRSCAGNTCTSACPALDPGFDGLACSDDTDCLGGGAAMPCGRDHASDALGRCRCQADADCGDGFACADPIAGPSPAGKVCRASHAATASTGVTVLGDAIDRWVGTRPIWNQHAYSVTNIADDGAVPRTSQWLRNWTQAGLNNFRTTTHGAFPAAARPDLTVKQAKITCDASAPTVSAEVCNRGSKPVGPGVPVAVYAATTPTRLRCQSQTALPLAPGDCATVSCAWTGPFGDATVAADDRGDGSGTARECREDNNLLSIHVTCPAVGAVP